MAVSVFSALDHVLHSQACDAAVPGDSQETRPGHPSQMPQPQPMSVEPSLRCASDVFLALHHRPCIDVEALPESQLSQEASQKDHFQNYIYIYIYICIEVDIHGCMYIFYIC